MNASCALHTSSSTHRFLLLIALLGGFALRLYHLGAESLWYDEAVSVWLAQMPVGAMLAHTAGDIHPPAYYLMLHLWQMVARPTPAHGLEFLYAWVSVAAGMLSLALLWAVGRRLLGESAAVSGVAVAAFHPFGVWYAQEVRMYTVGSALAMLALYATLRWLESGRRRWLAVYIAVAAVGLYTLYYLAFALVGIGAAALILRPPARRYGAWIAAHLGVTLLFAPWLPVLWRQATEPPVPPWRAAWTSAGAVWAAVNEALASLVIGQTPLGPLWIWAALALVLAFTAVVLSTKRRGVLVVITYVSAPLALLFAVSLWGTPLYHVRYLFPFAAPFALVIGAALVGIGRRAQIAGWAAGVALMVLYLLSLRAFWHDPAYRADDHRGAVRTLAAGWRRGDVILLNAGWITPLLEVYWPQVRDGGEAVPPSLAAAERLVDVSLGAKPESGADRVPVVRAGSVDGSSSLGWGNPASDFFAASAAETTEGLEVLKDDFARLWHYRLYDTVSDPEGIMRAWLDANTTSMREIAIPGRDYGRLELRDFGHSPAPARGAFASVEFGDGLRLTDANWPAQAEAGRILYVNLLWDASAATMTQLKGSLRLYAGDGTLVAQADGPLERVAAVGAPPWLPAGPYTLELVVYRQGNGTPLPVHDIRAGDGQRVTLGGVQVSPGNATISP